VFLAALAAAAGCGLEPSTDVGLTDVGESDHAIYDPADPPAPVATDACDESTHAADAWASSSSAHFTAYYLPGTAAETDIGSILAAREAAYTDIQNKLGIASSPTITVYLSPNRLAASAKGKSTGNAFPGADRYEVVYTGVANSFENTRVGNLLTRVLEYHLDPANTTRIPLLTTGVAEYLDQSGRDLHDAYALQLHAGLETRVRVASFDAGDVNGKAAGRAGSLVTFLIDRYGMSTFLDIFKATAVTSIGGCKLKSAAYGCINSADALTAMLDGVLTAETGDSWATVSALWKAEVDSHLATVNTNLPAADRNAIKNLVNLMDQATVTSSPAVYRSTMEGFYCEWGGDTMRSEIAARTTDAFTSTSQNILRFYATGTANFPTARVIVRRIDQDGTLSIHNLSMEKFPAGWRVTYGPDWW
jgi:hypothetical protein